jgi:hypothetical protein
MARIQIKFKLNPGREGVPLGKLSKQTENIELFLRSLASDLGLDGSTDMWSAKNFANGSCIYEAGFDALVDDEIEVDFNECALALTKIAIKKAKVSSKATVVLPKKVSFETVERFANLREKLDHDEPLGIAIIDRSNPEKTKWKWRYLDRLQLEEVGKSVEREIKYFGSIMGYAYEWTPGAENPFLIVRELISNSLVKCLYCDDDYAQVAKIFQKKKAVVNVYGEITLNQITGKQEITLATDFEYAPEFLDDDYDKFFGCAPNLSGDLSASEFIALGRADE